MISKAKFQTKNINNNNKSYVETDKNIKKNVEYENNPGLD